MNLKFEYKFCEIGRKTFARQRTRKTTTVKKHENELTKPPVVTSGARSWTERDGELKKLLETVHCLSVLKFVEEQWFVFLQNG